jgi:hypothetical protein
VTTGPPADKDELIRWLVEQVENSRDALYTLQTRIQQLPDELLLGLDQGSDDALAPVGLRNGHVQRALHEGLVGVRSIRSGSRSRSTKGDGSGASLVRFLSGEGEPNRP